MNYVPAKTSLDTLVQSYGVEQGKAKFPYSVLSETGFMSKALADEKGHILDPVALYHAFVDSAKSTEFRPHANSLEDEWHTFQREFLAKKNKCDIKHTVREMLDTMTEPRILTKAKANYTAQVREVGEKEAIPDLIIDTLRVAKERLKCALYKELGMNSSERKDLIQWMTST